jgi:hypothetical protein
MKSPLEGPSGSTLARIAADLDMIAGVLAAYPTRNPAVWNSAEWLKDRKDLEIACERIRASARVLDELSSQTGLR